MHKPEFVLENETHTFLWDFEIQTDHLIPARRPDLVIINKKKKKKKKRRKEKKKERTCRIVDFAVLVNNRMKIKESKKRDKILDLARERKKQLNQKVTVIPVVIGAPRTVPKGLVTCSIRG